MLQVMLFDYRGFMGFVGTTISGRRAMSLRIIIKRRFDDMFYLALYVGRHLYTDVSVAWEEDDCLETVLIRGL